MQGQLSKQRCGGKRPSGASQVSRCPRPLALKPLAAASVPFDSNVPKVDPFSSKKPLKAVAVAEAPPRTVPVEENARPTTSAPASAPFSEMSQKKWMWRGHKINFTTAGCGEPIVLIHGFGLCGAHYRKTIKQLAKSGYKVYAIDLLGFGHSDKPILQSGYSMEVWRDLVTDFCAEFTSGTQTTLVGNSIGGLVSLMVAADAPPDAIRGVVLLNTAGAMNNKGLLGDWRIMMAYPLLLFIDFVLSVPQWANAIFKNVKSKESIRKALLQVYSNPESVTDELVDIVHAPSCHRNAREVFVSVFTGPPGPKPFGLVSRIQVPILTLWGEDDKLTPADGPVGRFFQELPSKRPNATFKFLPGVGHCLHDDRPEVVHGELLPWLETLHLESSNSCASENNVGESKSVSERESVRTSVRESSLELPDFPTAPPSTTKELRKTPADKTTVRV